MPKTIRVGFTLFCTIATMGYPIHKVYTEVCHDPTYSNVGFTLAVVSVLIGVMLTFYIISGATPDHVKGGVIVGALSTIFMETFSIAWIHGHFMRAPIYGFFVLFVCLLLEIGDADVTEVTIRKTRD